MISYLLNQLLKTKLLKIKKLNYFYVKITHKK